MASLHIVVSTLCAAIGMAISMLLLLLLRKQAERQSEWFAGMLLGIVVLLMYTSILLSATLTNGTMASRDWRYFLTARALAATAAFIPPIILFGWRVSPIFKDGSPISSLLFRFSLLCALLTATFIWFAPSRFATDKLVTNVLVWNALLFILPGFHLLLRQRLSAQLRLCMKVTGNFYCVGLLASLVTASGIKEPSLLYTVLVAAQQMCILVGILGSFIFVARFRFADVFVKRSLRLVGLGVLATLGALGIMTLTAAGIASNPAYVLLIDIVIIFGLITLAITTAPTIDVWAERWVLQQADFKGQLVRFSSAMLDIDSETDLLAWMDTQLVSGLHLKMARTIPREVLPKTLSDELCLLGTVPEPCSTPSILQIDGFDQIETLLPVMVDGKMRYVIAICLGLGRSTLLSGEVQFLRAVAAQAGLRIHHIEVEETSRRQALRESLLCQQLTEAELRALRAQVNPHFLFNSLNTIADPIVTNPSNAERMTVRLASIFRYVLAQSHRPLTSLGEEFGFLRNYLQIEQERFGSRLSVEFILEPALAQVQVPSLLLQPIVENALKHGLAPKEGQGSLQISATSEGTSVVLTVLDDGIGFEARKIESPGTSLEPAGVGVTNTAARLQTMYGRRASFSIESAPFKGCRVSISYPMPEALLCAVS